jgi:small neutral amino acid transporter SnatA (MarC family)
MLSVSCGQSLLDAIQLKLIASQLGGGSAGILPAVFCMSDPAQNRRRDAGATKARFTLEIAVPILPIPRLMINTR